MNRQEHLEWCKQRALEYVNQGDTTGALASLFSDLRKHDETKDHAVLQLGVMLMFGGFLSSAEEVRKFIQDCN